MKKLLYLLIVAVLLVCLCACSGGIKKDEADALINKFFDAIEADDYELAKTYLHPERPADLKTFFEGLEKHQGLDFSEIEIGKTKSINIAVHDSSVDGATYAVEMEIFISNEDADVEIELVKNDNGFGIYNFDIDP